MTNPLRVEFELVETTEKEIQFIQLMMDASRAFDDDLNVEQKNRAIEYFNNWHKQTS